jgi:hypothetical protein
MLKQFGVKVTLDTLSINLNNKLLNTLIISLFRLLLLLHSDYVALPPCILQFPLGFCCWLIDIEYRTLFQLLTLELMVEDET